MCSCLNVRQRNAFSRQWLGSDITDMSNQCYSVDNQQAPTTAASYTYRVVTPCKTKASAEVNWRIVKKTLRKLYQLTFSGVVLHKMLHILE